MSTAKDLMLNMQRVRAQDIEDGWPYGIQNGHATTNDVSIAREITNTKAFSTIEHIHKYSVKPEGNTWIWVVGILAAAGVLGFAIYLIGKGNDPLKQVALAALEPLQDKVKQVQGQGISGLGV